MVSASTKGYRPPSTMQRLWKRMIRYRYIYLLLLPVVIYYVVFHYGTIYYAAIAFQNFKPKRGISGSDWVGFKNFIEFLTGNYAWRVIRNTLVMNLYCLMFGFTAPIILALMINQMIDNPFKRIMQTVTYMPYFVSVVVVCGILKEFCESTGLINDVLALFGFERANLLSDPKYFRTVFVASNIWQNAGWGTIIYLATLSGVDQTQHEAATIDGAGRLQRILHVNIPAIMPVIVVQFIMRMGQMMSLGYEKIILLYSPATYETADVISSYVYRRGLFERDYSYGAAVGLFNSLVNLTFLTVANSVSKRITENSLW